jgi:glutathione S-transferase
MGYGRMYTLHYAPDFASMCVHMVLMELDVPFLLSPKDIEAGDLDAPGYRRIHPLGKIPALETPDGPMFETGAIMLWLADQHGRLAPAPDDPARAAFLSWFVLMNNGIHTTMMDLLHPEYPGGDAGAAHVAPVAHATLREQYAALEAMVMRDRPDWLSPDHPSMLAYYLGMLMRWTSAYAPDPALNIPVADYPALHAVLAAAEARPAAQKVADVEGLGAKPFTKAG